MCLDLNKDAVLQTADEDIIVYKLLKKNLIVSLPEGLHGSPFSGVIRDMYCEGFISFYKGRYFFCTDEKKLDGITCNERFDKNFSWGIDENVMSIILEGITYTQRPGFMTYFRDFPVEIGETYYAELNRDTPHSVEEGLHSFDSIESARKEDNIVYVAKCCIPKGSSFYLGTFNGFPSYASSALKYLEIVYTPE